MRRAQPITKRPKFIQQPMSISTMVTWLSTTTTGYPVNLCLISRLQRREQPQQAREEEARSPVQQKRTDHQT